MNKGRMEAFSDGVLYVLSFAYVGIYWTNHHHIKGKVSMVIYAVSVPLAFERAWIAEAGYVIVAIMWLVPDRRIERPRASTRST